MPDKGHIFREIDKDLGNLDQLVNLIWDLVENQWRSALRAIRAREPMLAADAVSREDSVVELVGEMERASTRFLALRQPMADDLRFIIAALRISIDLERIGSYAVNIAKRAALSPPGLASPPARAIQDMAELVQDMLRRLRQDYGSRSASLSDSVPALDERVNRLYERVFGDLRALMAQDPSLIDACTELLFIARNIERSGDHAKNIARHLEYLFSGVVCPDRSGRAAPCPPPP